MTGTDGLYLLIKRDDSGSPAFLSLLAEARRAEVHTFNIPGRGCLVVFHGQSAPERHDMGNTGQGKAFYRREIALTFARPFSDYLRDILLIDAESPRLYDKKTAAEEEMRSSSCGSFFLRPVIFLCRTKPAVP